MSERTVYVLRVYNDNLVVSQSAVSTVEKAKEEADEIMSLDFYIDDEEELDWEFDGKTYFAEDKKFHLYEISRAILKE